MQTHIRQIRKFQGGFLNRRQPDQIARTDAQRFASPELPHDVVLLFGDANRHEQSFELGAQPGFLPRGFERLGSDEKVEIFGVARQRAGQCLRVGKHTDDQVETVGRFLKIVVKHVGVRQRRNQPPEVDQRTVRVGGLFAGGHQMRKNLRQTAALQLVTVKTRDGRVRTGRFTESMLPKKSLSFRFRQRTRGKQNEQLPPGGGCFTRSQAGHAGSPLLFLHQILRGLKNLTFAARQAVDAFAGNFVEDGINLLPDELFGRFIARPPRHSVSGRRGRSDLATRCSHNSQRGVAP